MIDCALSFTEETLGLEYSWQWSDMHSRDTVMKRAVIVGTILGCLVLFACGVTLSAFLLVTHWLAPAHASFQQELFFDYTKSEAVASAQFCPVLNGKVRWVLQLPPAAQTDALSPALPGRRCRSCS